VSRIPGNDIQSILLGGLAILFGLTIWQLIGSLGLVSPQLLATPSDVWLAFVDIIHNGYRETTLTENTLATLGRSLAGFIAATILGVPLGLWMGRSLATEAAVDYIIQFFRPLPPLSYLVLLILWFGAGDFSKVMLLFLGAFPTITTTAMAGVRQVDSRRINAAYSLGANERQVFLFVILPGSLSMIFTGLRIALAAAFSSVVAAELMAASNGLGWMVFSASRFLRNDVILLGIILLGIFGMALSRSLVIIDHHFIHWRGKD
jgi:taurine transport system permease protein